jgi:hypothetical protein
MSTKSPRRKQWNSPLELVIVIIVVAALVALLSWFFLIAANPLVAPFEI